MYHILLDCLRNTITHELSLSWGTNLQRHEKKNHQAKSKHLGRQTLDPSGTAIVTSSVRDLIMVNEIYDPCHIDADWSGWVALRTSRWHPTSPATAMKVSVTTNETGFGPNREAETTEWSKPSRKLVTHSLGSKSSTFSLIGGPVSADDLDDACRWESEASAAANPAKGTQISQLTDAGRSMHIRGKKKSASKFQKEQLLDPKRTKTQNDIERNDGLDLSNLAGYRSQRGGERRSFVDGLAAEVARSFSAPQGVTSFSAPYATDGILPTDPYVSASGERRKDLILENYRTIIPGYTGAVR